MYSVPFLLIVCVCLVSGVMKVFLITCDVRNVGDDMLVFISDMGVVMYLKVPFTLDEARALAPTDAVGISRVVFRLRRVLTSRRRQPWLWASFSLRGTTKFAASRRARFLAYVAL